jgi:aspartate aminotransferase
MFEESERLKKEFGPENVFDFTLGNPIAEPPKALKEELARICSPATIGMHRYMANSGYEEVREEIAEFHREKTGLDFTASHIIMTMGAAGGINVAFKTLLDPGDEVIVLCPYFVEFRFYITNHGGIVKLVDVKDDFHLDIEKIRETITDKTKAIIVNSPHNPTGVVYDEKELKELAALLMERRRKGQRITVISDEAYRKIIYDNITFPDFFKIYDDVVTVTSHSKDLALPGERIGYIAISPLLRNAKTFIDAAIFSNRILGFINAPAIMQRLVGRFQKNSVDIMDYQKKRDAIYEILVEAGFEIIKPMGAFYAFPKSPIPDDIEFVKTMQKHRVLGVPGTGFGKGGYFRLAYCVDMEVIEGSRKCFKEIGASLRRK